MNMPPRPSHMHQAYNPDAAALRQPPATPDMHQMAMRGQQDAQYARARAEDQTGPAIGGMQEDARGQMMDVDTARLHADALALNTKAGILKGMGMSGVPLNGMRNIQMVAREMGLMA